MGKPYSMKPAAVPTRGGRNSGSIYRSAIDDFLAQDAASVTISFEGRKPITVALQLRKAAKASGAKVAVVQRGGDVFLIKT